MNVNVSTATRWGLNAVILLSITLALYLGQAIFIPTVIALLLAAMLWPLATWMHQAGIPFFKFRRLQSFPGVSVAPVRWRLGWGLATVSVITLLIAIILATTVSFSLGLSKLFIDIGNSKKQEEIYDKVRIKLVRLGMDLHPEDEYLPVEAKDSRVFKTFTEFFTPSSANFQNLVVGAGSFGLHILWQSILVLFILLFLLLEGRMLSRRFVEIFGPHAAVQGKAVEALTEMAYQVRAYLVWRTIINFGMAGILGILYQALGLQLAWSWALLTAVLWYVPYLGPIAAGIPPILDAFISSSGPWEVIIILSFYIVWVVIEGYLVVPVVMGRSMEMNATTVMLACLFWERVWGAAGLFLAMPLIAAVKAICYHVPEWRPWANLMSSHDVDDPPAPEQGDSRRDGETIQVTTSKPEGVATRSPDGNK